jgi:chromosome segregation ATPase
MWLASVPPVTGQANSNSALTPQESLWSTALQIANELPLQIDAFSSSLTSEIASLRTSQADLLKQIGSLTLDNEALKASQASSRVELATSEAERKDLETQLSVSTASITEAKTLASRLEAEKRLLTYVAVGEGIGVVVLLLVLIL